MLNERLDRANVASITVIEKAHALPLAVFPKKWQFALMGAVLGLFGAGMMVLMSLSFRKTFIMAETVERVLGLSVVGAMPRYAAFAQPPKRAGGACDSAGISTASAAWLPLKSSGDCGVL